MAALLAYIRAEAAPLDAPMIPAEWDRTGGDDPAGNRWSAVYPLGRLARPEVFFHCRLVVRDSNFLSGSTARAVFICTGPRVVLNHLADRIDEDAFPWTVAVQTLAEFRALSGTTATRLRNAWPDERPRDGDGNPIGSIVGHYARMAGYDHEDAEAA